MNATPLRDLGMLERTTLTCVQTESRERLSASTGVGYLQMGQTGTLMGMRVKTSADISFQTVNTGTLNF